MWVKSLLILFFILLFSACNITTDTTVEIEDINTTTQKESSNDDVYISESYSEISVDESDEEDRDENDEGENEIANSSATTQETQNGEYTLLAWNDLGMHCFDGSDFSVFSILPPYNNLNAQLIKKYGTSNKHVTQNVMLTYEALSYNGHINTKSTTKTNFWEYLPKLFPFSTSSADTGLSGNKTPSTLPQSMKYNQTDNWFEADGIPIVNYDDNGDTNYYPMVRVVAKDLSGNTLATADVVLPVSDEMDCAKCHSSTSLLNDAKPSAGWENSSDKLKDYKYNILKLHDEKHSILSSDLASLKSMGYIYKESLYESAKAGTPILCAACHSSNALATTGVGSAKSLTAAIHSKHKDVMDPNNNLKLSDSNNRDACYSCHPGAKTECLRGAMGAAKDPFGNQVMQCQSCHGGMSDVGSSSREGWLDEPNCQVCHQNANRYESALLNGTLRDVLDNRFATEPNTPSLNKSLYRYSKGHGDLQCSSCHGATHAIYPSSHAADNILSEKLQGHSGTISECTSCHTTPPLTTNGGPHGMHTIGQSWVNEHEDRAENSLFECRYCHGSDYRGSVLSKTFNDRVFSAEHITKRYSRGEMVGCYDCHNGPDGDDD